MSSQENGRGASAGQEEAQGSPEHRVAHLEAQLETYKKTLTDIYELYDQKIDELSLIRRISDSLRTPLDLEGLARAVVEAVSHEIALDRLFLLLVDQDRVALRLVASFDAASDETRFPAGHEGVIFPLDDEDSEPARAVKAREPLVIALSEPGTGLGGRPDDPPVSRLYLPLIARRRTVGLLSLSRGAAQPFNDADVRVLTIISDQAATALANVQLFNELAAANVRLQDSERQARQTSLYLENLLETASDLIFTLDENGRINYVNRKVEEWGFGKDYLLGRKLEELLHGESSQSGKGGPILTPGQQSVEVGLRTAAGERKDVLMSMSLLDSEGGRNAGCLVLARDITERKQLERQLLHSEKLASIGILAAGVAHEIGNPLSAISGYTQILQGGGVREEESREYLEAITSQTARIERIIEDLLNFSRPSTGHSSDINLAEAMPSIMSMLSGQRSFAHMKTIFDLPPDLRPVRMDPDHLAQVVINIALNAAQAMPGGGGLTVSAREMKGMVELRLKDTGPGIPPEARDRIFDPFFTTKPVGQGTGLGLAIVHRLVESYGGSIEVESEPGHGTVFIVSLPAA